MKYGIDIVLLIPARTDTKYFHEYIFPHANTITFLKGRLKFGQSKNSAPFPSCIVYFGLDYLNLNKKLKSTGIGYVVPL